MAADPTTLPRNKHFATPQQQQIMKLSALLTAATVLLAAEAEARNLVDRESFVIDAQDSALKKRDPGFHVVDKFDFILKDDSLRLEKRGHHGKEGHKKGHMKTHKSKKAGCHGHMSGTSSPHHHDGVSKKVAASVAYFKNLFWTFLDFTSLYTSPHHDDLLMQTPNNAVTDLTVENPPHGEAPKSGPTLLRTALTMHPEVYNFASYVRDSSLFAGRFNEEDSYSIIFAPTDSALNNLDRKPWEFPSPVTGANEEEDEKVIRANVANFVDSHVSFEKSLTPGNHVTSRNGVVITLAERSESKQSVLAIDKRGRSLVADVVGHYKTGNGEIYIIDNCLIKP